VAAWELCNEPYLFSGAGGFFLNASNYLDLMKPYRDAIKTANSNAAVAIFFSDAGFPNATWDNGLASYTNKYWDMVTYHHYPQVGTNVTFADLVAMDNSVLISQTTNRVVNYLMPKNNSNVTYMVTEYDPLSGQTGNGPTTDGTLYGGIYAAEYAMRMSSLPQVMFIGSHELQDSNGIDLTNDQNAAVITAYDQGRTTNTAGLSFGFYVTAQAAGEAVANWAFIRSKAVYSTTVSGGPTVAISGGETIPAVYAQAYQGGNGKRYVVLTNKGATNGPVQIVQDGVVLTNQFLETFVTGSDPGATNSSPQSARFKFRPRPPATPSRFRHTPLFGWSGRSSTCRRLHSR
jgi:hypothetical protein